MIDVNGVVADVVENIGFQIHFQSTYFTQWKESIYAW